MSELHNIVPSHLASASKSQKLIFFETLLCLSAADGVQDDDEIKFISDNAKINGIDIEELENHCDPDTILQDVQKIKNRALALELIREMCFLAHVDNELSDEEVLLIGRVGQAMGISIRKIEQISSWVVDHIVWLEQAKIIFEED